MKRTKKSMFRAGLALALSLSLSLSLMITPVSAEFEDLTDTSKYECVGTLNENFDGLNTVEDLYKHVDAEVLSGTWQRSTRGNSGSASVADKALNITEPEGNGMWNPFSGVDFVFDKPLTPDYIVEVSYEITSITDSSTGNSVDTAGAVFFNNLSEPDAELKNVNSIGAGWWDAGSFQFFKAVENYKPESKGWIQRNGTSSVKTVYNLNNWTFDAAVTMGNGANSTVTALPIGPGSCDMNNTITWQEEDKETFVSIPESTFSRLTFAVRQGTSVIDNISVKAYKLKDNIEPQMTETFTGKTAGAMTGTNVENGLGKWVANTAWGGGFEYVEYTNAAGTNDIGIRANGNGNRLQYVPGMNFSKLYENDNSEITVGFDFITPDANPSGWIVMDWGDGFTNKYRNIPFFAIIGQGDKYKFTRCAHDVNGISEEFGNEFVLLDQNQAYTFEAKIYPATEMTYATIKQGEDVVYSGFYRMGQWRAWTEGHNVHTMSITEMWNTGGIIFDNFKMSARAFSAESQLGKTIDFNEFSNDGFLETIYWGSAKVAPAPANGETDMGNALNVVGEAEGVALPYFAEPVSEGVYRYTAMLYNKNLDVAEDESEGKKNSRSRVMIDAPKDASGFVGSLTLALLEDNTVSLGRDDKIAVAPNEWISVETIIDLNNKKTYLAVYDKDGTRLGIISSDFFANDSTEETQYTIDSLNSIRIRNWNSGTSIDSVIDNMKLEQLGSIGFTKNNNAISSASVGDNLGISFVLTDSPDAASSETCIIAYYDANGNQLISVDMPIFTMNPNSIFCTCNGATTVPAGAVTAKAFIWDISTLKPLAESAALSIVSAE